MSSYPPQYAYPSAPPVYRLAPNPPRLHWGWVLFLSVITCGIFGSVWLLVQAIWIRKMRGRSRALPLAIVNVAALPVMFLVAILLGVVLAIRDPASVQGASQMLGSAYRILGFVLYLFAVYTTRQELEQEPINIPLGGGMTFFFGPLYFQYHLQDYGKAAQPNGGPQTLGLGAHSQQISQGFLVPSNDQPDQPPSRA